MASRVCPNCFKPTRKEVCPACGIMTVRDQAQSGAFRNLLRRVGLARPAEERDLVGLTLLGRYKVTELVGHGGMGEVYRATQLSTLQEVALKVIKTDLAGDPDSIRRFFREARSSGSINHPNVVRVWEFGQLEDFRLFLAMEFLQGKSLADVLRAQRKRPGFNGLDYPTILEVGTQVASALHAAHSKGVIHRDLKPGNIILLDEGALVKVVDFGISKFVGAEASAITRTDLFIGTPAYASPEQAVGGSGELDGRSDLYSLGVVLYEMACGHTPFAGVDNPVAQLAARVHQDAPTLREQVAPDRVPDGLCVVVDRLLRRKREDRYQIAAEVVQDLAGLALEAGVQARTPSRGFLPAMITPPALAHPRTPPPPVGPSEDEVLDATMPAARIPQPGPAPTTPPPVAERRPVPWVALFALALAAASAGGMFFLLSRDKGGIPEPAAGIGVQAAAPPTRPAEPETSAKPAEVPPPVAATPSPPRECRLSIHSTPEGAAIYLGDLPVEGKKTPATLTFPCDRVPSSIRLVLAGYLPETVALSDLGFPGIQAAVVAPSLKRVSAPVRRTGGCRTDSDCRRGQYCSGGRCKDLL